MRRGMILLAALAAIAPGAAASFNQDPVVPLTDEQVLQLVNQDQRMTVPVRIANGGPWNFIIDTGAQRTVISRELANVLKLTPGPNIMLTAMTGTSRVSTALIPSLTISSIGAERIEAPALAARNLGAPGLLGIDTLQGHKVSIDFENNTMTVSPSVKRKRPLGPRNPDEVVVQARDYLGQLVVSSAQYRGRSVRVVLDTGTPVSIGNDALRRLVMKRPDQQLQLTSVTGDRLDVNYAQIGAVDFPGFNIQNLPVAFAAAAPFMQFKLDKRPALLLGMDALGLFRRVDIDFANRELRLLKPKNSPTEYTGRQPL